jgi:hypothetical protein
MPSSPHYRRLCSNTIFVTLKYPESSSRQGDKTLITIQSLKGGFATMKKLHPEDEIVKVDEELGIAWILLPPDANLGGFRGISPRIMDEEKFAAAKKKSEEGKG